MSSTNRPDQYWPVSGFAGDPDCDDIRPRAWVLVACVTVTLIVFGFVLWRDEFAPSAADVVEVQP